LDALELQKSPNLESLSVFRRYCCSSSASVRLNFFKIVDKGLENFLNFKIQFFLETLSLDGNDISNKGASAIADLMKTLPCLQHVYLTSNHIGDKGVKKLSQLLQDLLCVSP